MGVCGVFQGKPGMLVSRQVIAAAMLLRYAVSMSRGVMHLCRLLVILVVRSVFVAGRHRLYRHHLTGLVMGFFRQLMSVVRVLQSALGVPADVIFVPFFVVFRCRAMGLRRLFVHLGRLPVCFVHVIAPIL
jgi:hypothetical protein